MKKNTIRIMFCGFLLIMLSACGVNETKNVLLDSNIEEPSIDTKEESEYTEQKKEAQELNPTTEETAYIEEATDKVATDANEIITEEAGKLEEPMLEEVEVVVEEPVVEEVVEEVPFPVEGEIAVGNIVTFGRYEQDNDLSNGPEEIEWYVYECDEHSAKLACTVLLDGMHFAETSTISSYEESTVYYWSNNTLLADFTEDELNIITCSRLPYCEEGTIYHAYVTPYSRTHYDAACNEMDWDTCWYTEYTVDWTSNQWAARKFTSGSGYTVHQPEYGCAILNDSYSGVQPLLEISY